MSSYYLRTALLFLIGATTCSYAYSVEQMPALSHMSARYWAGIPGRDAYEVALLEEALKVTVEEYGPYKISLVVDPLLSSLRGRREVERGELINIYAAPLRPKSIAITERIIPIYHPLMQGLLGYRALTARAETLPRLSQVRSLEEFKSFAVGQGSGWLDAKILRANGISVVNEAVDSNLHLMLSR